MTKPEQPNASDVERVAKRCRDESQHIFPQRMRDGHAYHSTAYVLDQAAELLEALAMHPEAETPVEDAEWLRTRYSWAADADRLNHIANRLSAKPAEKGEK